MLRTTMSFCYLSLYNKFVICRAREHIATLKSSPALFYDIAQEIH